MSEIGVLNRKERVGTAAIHLTPRERSLHYLLAANTGRGLRAKLQNDWRRSRFIASTPRRGDRFLPMFNVDAPPRA
jgi:hypothetical protein